MRLDAQYDPPSYKHLCIYAQCILPQQHIHFITVVINSVSFHRWKKVPLIISPSPLCEVPLGEIYVGFCKIQQFCDENAVKKLLLRAINRTGRLWRGLVNTQLDKKLNFSRRGSHFILWKPPTNRNKQAGKISFGLLHAAEDCCTFKRMDTWEA